MNGTTGASHSTGATVSVADITLTNTANAGDASLYMTAGEAGSVTDSYFTVGCSEVLGCLDQNASNYTKMHQNIQKP